MFKEALLNTLGHLLDTKSAKQFQIIILNEKGKETCHYSTIKYYYVRTKNKSHDLQETIKIERKRHKEKAARTEADEEWLKYLFD